MKDPRPSKIDADPVLEYEVSTWFRWKDVPLLILFLPFGLFFGMHVAGLAMLIRRWFRFPYLAGMVVCYSLLMVPIWIANPTDGLLFPCVATGAVLLATIAPISLGGRDEIMNGANLEHSAPAHILLIIVYMVLPAIDAAMGERVITMR